MADPFITGPHAAQLAAEGGAGAPAGVQGQLVGYDSGNVAVAVTPAALTQPDKVLFRDNVFIGSAQVAGTFVMQIGVLTLPTASSAGRACFYFNPADYAILGQTTRLRLTAAAPVNAVAPAVTFTLGLYPITAAAGASNVIAITLGTVITGSTAALVSPAANSMTLMDSGYFDAPAAGFYAVGFVISGTVATSSTLAINPTLKLRTV